MRLGINELNNKFWLEKNYNLPNYNIEKTISITSKNPEWVHFGAGNIFRAFMCNVLQDMLNKGEYDKGLIAVEGYDEEIIDLAYRDNDNLSIYVELKGNGSLNKTVLAAVTESLKMSGNDYVRLREIFENASLKMATFTVTEKAYSLVGNLDLEKNNGPMDTTSYMGKIASLLYFRYLKGLKIAMVSMDNCSANGDKLKKAIMSIATMWVDKKYVDEGFITYLNSDVSFPCTMIDKITPRPDEGIKDILVNDGLENLEAKITKKGTYISSFVNAEESQYLVIEDNFPNGKIQLSGNGIYYTDRETVEKVERMKVSTCLNPLHTCLAIFGCLLNYQKISEEMNDKELLELIKKIGYVEGLPVVVNPGIMNPKDFIDDCINNRFPNPYMPDTPWRIATDTSQKLSIRFGQTVKEYIKLNKLNELKYIPLVFAGWIRYLMGVNDFGDSFKRSSDPLLDKMDRVVNGIKLDEKIEIDVLKPILEDDTIFGVDLVKCGLADLVLKYFNEMNTIGGVRKTLEDVLNENDI